MTGYILRRIVQAIPVLIGITLASFLLIHLVPGDPARIILGARATPQAIADLNHELGLDRSLLAQYASFVGGAVHLDFGDSIKQNKWDDAIGKAQDLLEKDPKNYQAYAVISKPHPLTAGPTQANR